MLKTYLKIAWRNLSHNKLYSAINWIGLTVGITSCILIGLYIGDEWSFDRFHVNGDRIVRVTMEYFHGGTLGQYATTGTKVGPQFKRTFPVVTAFTRIFQYPRVITVGDKTFDENRFLYADSAFFTMFSYQLTRGNPATVLSGANQVVLTESMATKYFGNADPIGKTMTIANMADCTVTGIVLDPPANSQIRFDFVSSFSSLDVSKTEQWWTANYITYLMVDQPADIPVLQQEVRAYMNTPDVRGQAGEEGRDYLTYNLQALKKVHLYSSLNGLEANGNITYVYVLGVIALLILAIACVNYTNLSTAQSASRSGEIGIRKVLGAGKGALFGQTLLESGVLVVLSLITAVVLSAALLPMFNALSGKALHTSVLFQPWPLLALIVLGILVSLMAGSYPAFLLATGDLVAILKSGFRTSNAGGGIRKSLIIFQFVISVFLIISTIVILQQLSFIQHKNLGYDKDHIIVLPVDARMHAGYDAIKAAISLNPHVLSVGGAYGNPTNVQWGDGIKADNGAGEKNISVVCIPSDLDFVSTLGIHILTGSGFTKSDFSAMDTSDNGKNYRYSFLINETAAKDLGWTPADAIGRTIVKGNPGIVKGVVADFHMSSMHNPIGPLVIFLDTQYVRNLFVKVSGNDLPGTIAGLERVWKERVPYRAFEYHFLDDDFNALYNVETRTAQLFSAFSATAILLACLGLFALAAYTTVQRTKEIGIRKVLGASLWSITGMLSGNFVRLVGIAVLIAFPLSWWAMERWLRDFAYRIHLQWWVFAAAGLLTLLIALITVSVQALRAASANPIESLRSE